MNLWIFLQQLFPEHLSENKRNFRRVGSHFIAGFFEFFFGGGEAAAEKKHFRKTKLCSINSKNFQLNFALQKL